MDIFEYAKQMEIDGKKLYEAEIQKTQNPGLQKILKMLISQEEEHWRMFDAMQKGTAVEPHKASFKGMKNIFQEMQDSGTELPGEQLDLYRKILEIEEKSEKFYREAAEKEQDAERKEQILGVAQEEHNHYVIIHNIIEMVNRPNSWVDDAEFNHLEEY